MDKFVLFFDSRCSIRTPRGRARGLCLEPPCRLMARADV